MKTLVSIVSTAKINKLNNIGMSGSVIIIEKDEVKIHTYISPENSTLVTSHIIETKNILTIVDAQFIRPCAKELLDYVKSLEKPVNRVIITHSHPDHWFGLEYFTNLPIYSLFETQGEINTLGDITISSKKPILGELVTSQKTVPTHILNEGTDIIDGLKYEFNKIKDAEAGIQLLIKLPDLNILIAQDLVFNEVHLFLGQNQFNNWIKNLEFLKELKGYEIILAGHGKPTDITVFDKTIAYLNDTQKIFNSVNNGNDLKIKLVGKYPYYKASVLLDISNSFLYK